MRPSDIVVGDPVGNLGAGVIQIGEEALVEQFIAHPTIEVFDEAVLHRLSRCDKVPIDDCVLAPGEHGVTGELASLIAEEAFYYLDAPVRRLGAMDVPVPFSPALEDTTIPNEQAVVKTALALMGQAGPKVIA